MWVSITLHYIALPDAALISLLRFVAIEEYIEYRCTSPWWTGCPRLHVGLVWI
jgi:hypothetical protein